MARHTIIVGIGALAAASALAIQTTPVAAAPARSSKAVAPALATGNIAWWAAAAHEAYTTGVNGAVAGAVTTAVFGTPGVAAAAAIGGAAGAAGGFASYAVSNAPSVASSSSDCEGSAAGSTDEAATAGCGADDAGYGYGVTNGASSSDDASTVGANGGCGDTSIDVSCGVSSDGVDIGRADGPRQTSVPMKLLPRARAAVARANATRVD